MRNCVTRPGTSTKLPPLCGNIPQVNPFCFTYTPYFIAITKLPRYLIHARSTLLLKTFVTSSSIPYSDLSIAQNAPHRPFSRSFRLSRAGNPFQDPSPSSMSGELQRMLSSRRIVNGGSRHRTRSLVVLCRPASLSQEYPLQARWKS